MDPLTVNMLSRTIWPLMRGTKVMLNWGEGPTMKSEADCPAYQALAVTSTVSGMTMQMLAQRRVELALVWKGIH